MKPTNNKPKYQRVIRIKHCRFCDENVNFVDYKASDVLKKFMTEMGRIIPRRVTGNCKKHQDLLKTAVKKARNIALVR